MLKDLYKRGIPKNSHAGEPILDNSQNLVIISMKSYEEMVKAKHNAEYMAEIGKNVERLAKGEGVHKTIEELETIENE